MNFLTLILFVPIKIFAPYLWLDCGGKILGDRVKLGYSVPRYQQNYESIYFSMQIFYATTENHSSRLLFQNLCTMKEMFTWQLHSPRPNTNRDFKLTTRGGQWCNLAKFQSEIHGFQFSASRSTPSLGSPMLALNVVLEMVCIVVPLIRGVKTKLKKTVFKWYAEQCTTSDLIFLLHLLVK